MAAAEPSAASSAPPVELEPLTPDQVKYVISQAIRDSEGGQETSSIANQRKEAMDYYFGKPLGNEVEGRSTVVVSDVADTVEWIMPSVMKIFLGGSRIVRYNPVGPEDVPRAEQATDVVNHLFLHEMDGFMVIHDWVKTCLIEKVGFVHSHIEEYIEPRLETYTGLTQIELALLLSKGDYEVIAQESREELLAGEEGSEPIPVELFDVKVRRTKVVRRIVVDGVPPEEALVTRRTVKCDQGVPFIAQRKRMTKSELLAMGFEREQVLNLKPEDDPEWSLERESRWGEDEDWPSSSGERPDVASQEVWITQGYILMDEDGDGYSERRKVTVVGDEAVEILEDEEVDFHGFATICPIPVPYKLFGQSVADVVMDLQRIRTTLLRQMLDNLYLLNNVRTAVFEGMVELDDLLTSRPGGVVRCQGDPSQVIQPIIQPALPSHAFNMLEFLEGMRENRTGITRYNQGLDASSLNQTATGISKIMNASQARIELICRIFAATGFRDLFRIILRLLVTGGFKERVLRLRNEWVEVDPSSWNDEMDCTIQLGLGVGQAAERMGNLEKILGMQAALHERGFGDVMVTMQNTYNAVEEVVRTMGDFPEGIFFTDPAGKPPPEPKPDAQLEKAKLDAQADAQKLQIEQAKLALEKAKFEWEQQEALMRIEVEREKIASQERVALAKIDADAKKAAAGNGAAKPEGRGATT